MLRYTYIVEKTVCYKGSVASKDLELETCRILGEKDRDFNALRWKLLLSLTLIFVESLA